MTHLRVLCAVGIACAAVAGSACTLIGLAAGQTVDERRPPKHVVVPRGELSVLDSGARIELLLRDGSRFTGRYLGLETSRPPSYETCYAKAREALAAEQPLPALGPGARLTLVNGKVVTGELHGFGPGFVSVRERSGRTPRAVSLDKVAALADAAGNSVSASRLRALIDEGQLPSTAALRVARADARTDVIEYDDVVGLDVLEVPSHAGRTTGMVLGIVGDAMAVRLIVMWIIEQVFESWDVGFCPLFESYDGREWKLDAEPLAGALSPAVQRTEAVRLEHVAEVDGEYRLRVRNDKQELDYLDALALRVVDHAPGTEVVPGVDGRPHVIRHLLAAVAASEVRKPHAARSGLPLASLLASADDKMWLSETAGLVPEPPAPLRDGVEVEYPRLAGADSAVLVVRAGATSLAPLIMHDALALHGRDLSAFYARLESEPAARAMFAEAWEREMLPAVSVWDGAAWRRVGPVRDLPVLILRDVALPLDLRGIPGETVRLRIDASPGLWMLDRLALAFGDDTPVAETRLDLVSAVTGEGRDVTGILRRPDGRRYMLRPGMDTATLRFTAPPRRPGLERSVLLEATGYYSLIVPADGTPRSEEFRRLVQEPGAMARYALDRAQRPH